MKTNIPTQTHRSFKSKLAVLAGAAVVVAAVTLTGCGGASQPSESAPTEDAALNPLPESLIANTAPPSDAIGVVQARKNPEPGKSITLSGFVGGRVRPFVEGRAILTLADSTALIQCNENPDDNCRTPWDACCETSEMIKASVATVQVVDDSGTVLKGSLDGFGGIEAGRAITVQGEVAAGSNPEVLIVNAKRFYVQR